MLDFEELASLDGLISRGVGELLHNYAACVPADQAIVELGSYRGKSTCYLATGSSIGYRAPVFAVDAWSEAVSTWRNRVMDRLPSPEFEDFQTQVALAGMAEMVTPIQSDTVKASAQWGTVGGNRTIGLLYIDGDHHHEAVMADFRAWRPFLADDALIVFDDYDTPTNPGVLTAVRLLEQRDEIRNLEKHEGRLGLCNPGKRPLRLSASIMAHPTRREFAEELQSQLDRPAPIIYDQEAIPSSDPRQRWKVGAECWATYGERADWHVVIQDDAVPCADMLAGLEMGLNVLGSEGFVSAFVGRGKPSHHHVRKAIRHALAKDHAWMSLRSLAWGVAIAAPTRTIPDMLEWCSHPEREDMNYDKRIGIYYRDVLRWRTWHPIPSLVEHRALPSLVGHDSSDRDSFMHYEGSALDIDWNRTPPSGLAVGL